MEVRGLIQTAVGQRDDVVDGELLGRVGHHVAVHVAAGGTEIVGQKEFMDVNDARRMLARRTADL